MTTKRKVKLTWDREEPGWWCEARGRWGIVRSGRKWLIYGEKDDHYHEAERTTLAEAKDYCERRTK